MGAKCLFLLALIAGAFLITTVTVSADHPEMLQKGKQQKLQGQVVKPDFGPGFGGCFGFLVFGRCWGGGHRGRRGGGHRGRRGRGYGGRRGRGYGGRRGRGYGGRRGRGYGGRRGRGYGGRRRGYRGGRGYGRRRGRYCCHFRRGYCYDWC